MAKERIDKSSDNGKDTDELEEDSKKMQKIQGKKLKGKVIKQKIPLTKASLNKEKEIAMDFAVKAHQKFDRIIKASILFGSQARNDATKESDIDIIFVIDDSSIKWDLELIAWYREELSKLISSENYGKELHINSVKLTTWWQDLINGDPVIMNILRYGEVLIDSGGFFAPLKNLLADGKMKSTPEAIYNLLERAPNHLARSRAAEMSAIEGVYWTIVDSAQAALMTAGKVPPSPERIPDMLAETFVDSGVLRVNFVKIVKDIYALHKSILYGEVSYIKGSDIDSWQDTANKFLNEMTRIISQILEEKK